VLVAIYLKHCSTLLFSETPDIKLHQILTYCLPFRRQKSHEIVNLQVCVNFLENSCTKKRLNEKDTKENITYISRRLGIQELF